MGASPPYLYSQTSNVSLSTFNPKSVSQAALVAAIREQTPKPKQEGPLINFNKHPDSWILDPPKMSDVNPLPANMRQKVLIYRGIQLALRVMELIAALGLLFCVICLRGMAQWQGLVMRIPPGYDAFTSIYAIWHYARLTSRPAGSSASYHIYVLIIDCFLVPFYVYTSLLSHKNYTASTDSSDRWTSIITSDGAWDKISLSAWLLAMTVGSLHLLSIVMDVLLLLAFRKISRLPPDFNPLRSSADMKMSKHKHKSSELSGTSSYLDYNSPRSILSPPQGYEVPNPTPSRQVPFFRSRTEANTTYSAHKPVTAQVAVNGADSPRSMNHYAFRPSRPGTIASPRLPDMPVRELQVRNPEDERQRHRRSDVHSPFAGHTFPYPPGQSRLSHHVTPLPNPPSQDHMPRQPPFEQEHDISPPSPVRSSPNRANRNWTPSPERYVNSDAHRPQDQPLLPKQPNWYVFEDDASDKSSLHSLPRDGNETVTSRVYKTDLHRNNTVTSSVYSDDTRGPNSPRMSAGQGKGYGNLVTAVVGRGYGGAGSPKPVLMQINGNGNAYGNDGTRGTGVDLEGKGAGGARLRNASGKDAEEGRGVNSGEAWNWWGARQYGGDSRF